MGIGGISDNASAAGQTARKVNFDAPGDQTNRQSNAPKSVAGSKMMGRSEKSKEDIYAEKTVAEMQQILAEQNRQFAEIEAELRKW